MKTTHNTSLRSFAYFAGFVCSLWGLLHVNTAHAEYLDRLMLLDLLRSSQFETLDQTLSQQEHLYHQGKIPEQHLEAAYLSFTNSDPGLELRLNDWVENDGSSGIAHLARGIYYWRLGWIHRGNRYINDTPNERIRGMKTYFALANKDLHHAVQVNVKSSIAYAPLISIAMSFGNRKEVERLMLEGLERDIKSMAIRIKYLASLVPWWSGLSNEESLKRMEQFITQTITAEFPSLSPLRGYPDYIRGKFLARNKQRQKAVAYYKKALAHGPYYWFSYELGNNYFSMGNYAAADQAFMQALRERPQVADIHHDRARALVRLGQTEQALEEFQAALQLDSHEPEILTQTAYLLGNTGRYQEAIDLLKRALINGAHDEYVVEKLGRIYLYDLHQPTEGLEFLRRATELNPEWHNYWYNYGMALYQLNLCEAIEAFQHYQSRCEDSQKCSEEYLNWVKNSIKYMIWKRGCWRHTSMKSLFKEMMGQLVPF